MGFLAPLAALLGLEVGSVVSRAKSSAVLYGLLGLFTLLGLFFLVAAGFMALADYLTPIIAALIFAGAFLLIALALYLGTLISRRRREREAAEKRRSSETGAFLTTAAITALPMLARSPMLLRLGLPAAAIAAFTLLRGNDKPNGGL
jgi:hypothetical protein